MYMLVLPLFDKLPSYAFLMLMTVITFGSAGIKVKAACSHKATGKWQITKNDVHVGATVV